MNRYLLLSILLVCSMQLSAQKFFNLNNWEIAKVNVHFGMDKDMLKDMHHDMFLDMSKEAILYDYSNLEFENTDVYSMICENPNIRLEASLSSPHFKNTEWRIGLNAIINRIDAITYSNSNYGYYGDSEYLNFNNYSNEISLETAVLKALPVGKRISLQGGIGANVGYSYRNSLDIWGSSLDMSASQVSYTNLGEVSQEISRPNYEHHSDSYELRDGVSQRAYLIAGVNYRVLKRVELGVDIRRGYGYRAIFGSPVASTKLHAFSVSAKYKFKAPKAVPFTKK